MCVCLWKFSIFFITRLILALIAQIQSKAAVLPSGAPEVDVYSLPQPIPWLKARETTAICIALGPDEVSSAMKGTAMELSVDTAWPRDKALLYTDSVSAALRLPSQSLATHPAWDPVALQPRCGFCYGSTAPGAAGPS